MHNMLLHRKLLQAIALLFLVTRFAQAQCDQANNLNDDIATAFDSANGNSYQQVTDCYAAQGDTGTCAATLEDVASLESLCESSGGNFETIAVLFDCTRTDDFSLTPWTFNVPFAFCHGARCAEVYLTIVYANYLTTLGSQFLSTGLACTNSYTRSDVDTMEPTMAGETYTPTIAATQGGSDESNNGDAAEIEEEQDNAPNTTASIAADVLHTTSAFHWVVGAIMLVLFS
ncbi:hypothetical protein MPSEU_000976700 [Mayamaea pseudoterrestris]|nr:hypothetical protein MPSEU_000976700 [Mayamaea pseudoterrestris]